MDENTTLNEELEKLDEEFEENEELDEDEEAIDEGEEENDDSDLEYDDDGNIVIPDDDYEDGEGDEDAQAEEADKGEGSDKPDDAKADEKTTTEKELEKIKAQTRETLEKLGVKIDGDDVLGGLIKLAAEAEDKTPEEYLEQKAENEKLEAAKKIVEQQQGEAIRKADLEELHRLFPETSRYTDISQIPNFKRFGELRVMGLSADEAYSASHTNAIRANAAAGAKKSLIGTKSHLQTSVPKGAKDDAITMPKRELASMREYFPNLSDKEIVALYKKTQR